MTASEPQKRADLSRRRMLAALAPVPLITLGGCSGTPHTAAASVGPKSAPGSGASSPTRPAGATAQPASPATTTAPIGSLPNPEVSHAPGTDAVALTFHGAGSPALAEALLAEAEKAGARLTVLAVGQWLATYPQMARRILAGGHELGNHTEHHLNIDAMSQDRAYQEIERCAQRLEQLTGSRGRWFRQSQSQHASATVRAAARRAGYTTLLSYDLDSLDYLNPGTRTIEHTVLNRIQGGDVVSLHLGHRETVKALPVILDGLNQRGLRAVTASELFPLSTTSPPPSVPGTRTTIPPGAPR